MFRPLLITSILLANAFVLISAANLRTGKLADVSIAIYAEDYNRN